MWREYWDTLREYAGIAFEHVGMWREYLAIVRGHLANWRDYAPFFGPTAAILNGLLVVAVALLPFKTVKTKLRIGITALLFAVAAIGATAYAEYSTHRQEQRQRTFRSETRTQLEALSTEGTGLLAQIADSRQALPVRQADQWAQKAELLLNERLGESYVARFRSDIAPLGGESSSVMTDRLGYWRAVRNRVLHLQRITAELPK